MKRFLKICYSYAAATQWDQQQQPWPMCYRPPSSCSPALMSQLWSSYGCVYRLSTRSLNKINFIFHTLLGKGEGIWYLDTRQEEYSYIRGKWKAHLSQFQIAAKKLKAITKGRTLIRGDCKAANILFSADSSKCALYDFQYVGSGLGTQDVVYFLGTSIDGSLLRKNGDEELLQFYYWELKQALNAKGVDVERENFTFEVLKEQFEIARGLDEVHGWVGKVGKCELGRSKCAEDTREVGRRGLYVATVGWP